MGTPQGLSRFGQRDVWEKQQDGRSFFCSRGAGPLEPMKVDLDVQFDRNWSPAFSAGLESVLAHRFHRLLSTVHAISR
jgi:hypothetical protein